MILDEEEIDVFVPAEVYTESVDDSSKEEKKIRKNGLLNWFKLRKRDNSAAALMWPDGDKSSGSKSFTSPLTPQSENTAPVYQSLETQRERADATDHHPVHEKSPMEETKVSDEIETQSGEIVSLERKPSKSMVNVDQAYGELLEQLNEKAFELEVKTADNRVIQEQLNQKIHECDGLREVVGSLSRQLEEVKAAARCPKPSDLLAEARHELIIQAKAAEVEELKRKLAELSEQKIQLETRNQRLADECSYAKGLAAAAGAELKALSEEVAKLMAHNERLAAEAAAAPPPHRTTPPPRRGTTLAARPVRRDAAAATAHSKRQDPAGARRESVGGGAAAVAFEAALQERERREAELQRRLDEAQQREARLENELAGMWVLVAKLKKPNEKDNGTEPASV